MLSSPLTPTRRPKSSSFGVKLSSISTSPQSDGHSSKRPSNSRRSSQYSLPSPSSTRLISSHDRGGYFDPRNAGGSGNLADELADAFGDEDENEDELQNGLDGLYDRADAIRHDQSKENEHPTFRNVVQNGHAISILPAQQATSGPSLTSLEQSSYPGHTRKTLQYDGSGHGHDSDLEITYSPVLEACLAAVESLACRDIEANGSDADEIVQRVADSLKDLGSQAGVENYAMRLIAAHTALTTHVSQQTRTLLTLTHSLVSPLSGSPDPDFVDELLPLLASLGRALPATTSHAFLSLHNLHNSTSDLTSVLTYLSDMLHMMRQTTTLASRRLRGVREIVIEMRREMEVRERGILWVEKGNWEGRLAERECARVCGEVVGGFEEICASWRKKLARGTAGVEVVAA